MRARMQRFRSLSEIERYPQSSSDIRIPLFDKESAAFCFEKSREILSKPFNLDLNLNTDSEPPTKPIPTVDDREPVIVGHLSKKARDFIGENLIDIENTLKALNLDFLQTFNELEKTDSAETLFGETYGYDSGMQNPKIRTSAIKLSTATANKLAAAYGSTAIEASPPKSAGRSIQCSPLAGSFNPMTMAQFYADDADKRSSTPDTGFASRETNASSSRRGSQKSSYSPQDNHYSPREFSYSVQDTRGYLHELTKNNRNKLSSSPIKTQTVIHTSNHSIHGGGGVGGGSSLILHNTPPRKLDVCDATVDFPNRQRSMSFTENYELKSPVMSEPQPRGGKYSSGSHISSVANSQRVAAAAAAAVAYKPRSIRARNLRRLSYNPVVLDSSSSSSSETEFDRSIAHSECDIRSSMLISRRRRQYLNRKSSVSTIGQDKLYGSNASIKSAPQYNYGNDRQVKSYLHQKFACNYDENGTGAYPFAVDAQQHYRETTGSGGGSVMHTPPPPPPPRGFELEPLAPFNRNILYSEFDVSKLTGKSPTTQSFLQELFPEPGPVAAKSKSTIIAAAATVAVTSTQATGNSNGVVAAKPNVFQWPEKIHASAVKQNDLLWRQHHAKAAVAAAAAAAAAAQSYSSDSSSTETDAVNFGVDFGGQRMPPSPAP